jgi:hypothetical protein
MMQVVQVKICPACDGTRVLDVTHRLAKARQEFQCDHCRGEGIVPLVTCRGCGRPAMHWDAKHPYCGRKECWDKLVETLDLTIKARPRAVVPFGPALHLHSRVPEITSGFVRNSAGRYWNPITRQFQDRPVTMLDGGRLNPREQEVFRQACERDLMC